MSAPAPANRRSASGSRRFDYCRLIELDYVPMETGYMVSMRPTKGYAASKSPTKGYTSTKSPERRTNSPSTPRPRRPAAPPSGRDLHGNTSLSSGSNNSSSCRGSDCSPTKGRHQKYTSCTDNHGIRPPPPEQYLTPLQQKELCIRHLRARLRETVDSLQDRDTEIDELRGQLSRMQDDWVEEECHRVEAQLALKEARREIQQLKDAVDTVCASLGEGGAGSGDAGLQKYFQDINLQNHKLENLLRSMELAQTGLVREGEALLGCRGRVGGSAPASVSGESPAGPRPVTAGRGSCSCDGSPARSLTRSSTYIKLSDPALADRNGNGPEFPCPSGEGTQDSGFVCCGDSGLPSRADLLLEAAFLSEETASLLSSYAQSLPYTLPHTLPTSLPHSLPTSLPHAYSHTLPHTLPHSSTSEKMLHCALGGAGSVSHPCLSHHHLYLHHLREQGIQTESCPVPTAAGGHPADLDTIAEQRTFRSQACSPTSTWMSDEEELGELDSIATTTSLTTATLMTTATEPIPVSRTPLVRPLPRSATMSCSMEFPLCEEEREGWGENRENEEREEEEEGEVSTVGGGEGERRRRRGRGGEEDATPEELAAGMQGEAGLGGPTGERSRADNLESPGAEDGLQERQGEVGLQERQGEVGLQERQGEVELQERHGEVGPQGEVELERRGEVGLQGEVELQERQGEVELQGEVGLQERHGEVELQGEVGLQERQGEVGLQERQREVELQERQGEVGLQERQGEVELQERQGEVGLQERQGEVGLQGEVKLEERQVEAAQLPPGMEQAQPHTSQPRRSTSQEEMAGVTVVTEDVDDDDDDDVGQGAVGSAEEEEAPVQKSYWSRHFLVDLLAVAVPVVPTVAWLCRGPVRTGQPMYHIGMLLRGCCTVALHSLRRGGGLRHYPAGGGDLGGTQI